jgi:hypothetical protein
MPKTTDSPRPSKPAAAKRSAAPKNKAKTALAPLLGYQQYAAVHYATSDETSHLSRLPRGLRDERLALELLPHDRTINFVITDGKRISYHMGGGLRITCDHDGSWQLKVTNADTLLGALALLYIDQLADRREAAMLTPRKPQAMLRSEHIRPRGVSLEATLGCVARLLPITVGAMQAAAGVLKYMPSAVILHDLMALADGKLAPAEDPCRRASK